MTALSRVRDAGASIGHATWVFLRDVGAGLLEVSHSTLAMLGLLVVGLSLYTVTHADVRHTVEEQAFGWLQSRQEARVDALDPTAQLLQSVMEPEAVSRATAADAKELTRPQATVAQWISRRYRVAQEPINRLVKEAWTIGDRAGIDPTLILAIMAVESSFNPFAQSSVGAQGLMQVMTQVHDDKYESFGGHRAAFDPVTNLRVGVLVLKDCISRAGSAEAGLRFYVGAANLEDDGGYAGRVLAEQARLRLVANGKPVPITAPLTAQAPAPEGATAVGLPASASTPPAEDAAPAAPDRVALLR